MILRDDYGHEWAPFYQDNLITLYNGDARVLAPLLPELPGRVHVLTDAPYSKKTHENSRAGARKTPLHHGDGKLYRAAYHRAVDFGFAHLSRSLQGTIAEQSRRLATHWILIFSDAEGQGVWEDALEEVQVEHVRVGEWEKVGGTPQMTGDRPGVGHEVIEVAHQTDSRGKPIAKSWNGGGKPARWKCPIVLERGGSKDGETRGHETQKPEKLFSDLILDFTLPGDTVIDFTSGWGTTLVCAARLGRKAIGFELRPGDCLATVQRRLADLANVSFYAAVENPRARQEILFT